MFKKLFTIIIIILVVVIIFLLTGNSEQPSDTEQICIDSGGIARIGMCCESTEAFPNLCLIGPCGCSPSNSHEIKICDCGEGCFDGTKCVFLEEDISTILENLKQETEIAFSEIQEVEFDWFTQPGMQKTSIQGKGLEVEEIPDQQYIEIESFFKDNGFEIDQYNITSGTVVGSVGYKKNEIVCRIIAGITGYKEAEGQWIPEEWDTNDVEVKCGKSRL